MHVSGDVSDNREKQSVLVVFIERYGDFDFLNQFGLSAQYVIDRGAGNRGFAHRITVGLVRVGVVMRDLSKTRYLGFRLMISIFFSWSVRIGVCQTRVHLRRDACLWLNVAVSLLLCVVTKESIGKKRENSQHAEPASMRLYLGSALWHSQGSFLGCLLAKNVLCGLQLGAVRYF